MRSICSAAWTYDGTTLVVTNAEGITGAAWLPSGALAFSTNRGVPANAIFRCSVSPKSNAGPGQNHLATGRGHRRRALRGADADRRGSGAE